MSQPVNAVSLIWLRRLNSVLAGISNLIDGIIQYRVHGVCARNLLGNIFFFLQGPTPGRSTDIKASPSIDENCILLIRHFTALASS